MPYQKKREYVATTAICIFTFYMDALSNKQSALDIITELITRFDEQLPSYKKADYNETQTRKDFIDPFFEALGWDMNNKSGHAEAYREVIHEDKLKVNGVSRAPDYSFRLVGGKRLFFLEAKKPSVLIKDEIPPAYQVRRYGWSAGMPISLMTDFEEFAIYDTTLMPKIMDKASKGRIRYLTYKDYIDEWDFIWDTFSRERIVKGGLDKFLAESKNKKGTGRVDHEFLTSLDAWRKYLATSISLNNKTLDEDEINYAVQQTLDRIIFLRIAEDRGVEPYANMQLALKQGDYYKNLLHLFKEADARYNSGLFDFKKDKISSTLTVDNKVIKTILNQLYYPESPYEFSVLPVEILGSAYEQFLGKQIRIDSAHRARIEEKPEVRKAGGVYYTPQYIVDYIVEHTLGQVITERASTPEAISALRIVDPACGSGSFLIGAYQYLLDWHLDYYTHHARKTGKNAPLTPDGHLTTAEKKRILLNNIYGVDIDVNAVEVTKLSLLLKCLEGETHASIAHQMSMFKERVLPTLEDNIKSGNSLIDLDFYASQLDFGEEKKIKPFSWERGFPEVFKEQGGFDVVIGNPPYVRIQNVVENSPQQILYFNNKYKSAQKGNYDIYVIFIEKGLELVKEKGRLGYILPHKFFNAKYGTAIRHLLLQNNSIERIVHFGYLQIFENATTYTCLLFLHNDFLKKQFEFIPVSDLNKWQDKEENKIYNLQFSELNTEAWNFVTGNKKFLFTKLATINEKLESVTERIFQGLKTGADGVFILKFIEQCQNNFIVYSKELNQEFEIERQFLHKLIKGGNSRNYTISESNLFIIFPYNKNPSSKLELINEKLLKSISPLTYEYLLKSKKLLLARDKGKINSKEWYGYSRNQALDIISSPKIFTPDISEKASYSFDEKGDTFFTGGVSGGYGIIPKSNLSSLVLLALLNSKLLDWYLKIISTPMRGGWL